MLTIFTTPKPFAGITAVHQGNAIGSWLQMPGGEVMVMGSDGDIKFELGALEIGASYCLDIESHDSSLPYINALFGAAERLAKCDLLVYANADLILLPDILDAMKRASERFPRFLLVGQRWDVSLDDPLEFTGLWQRKLYNRITSGGVLHSVSGKDWFGWARPLGLEIPPFVVGRPGWDNKVLDMALQEGIPVIDATQCVTAIHPNHGYPDNWLYDEASEYNRALCDVPTNRGRISEATWKMTAKGEIMER